MERYRPTAALVARHTMPTGYSHAEAASRCFAAARTAMQGDRWGHTFHVDCAADLLADVLAVELSKPPRRGRPADVLAWIAYVETHPITASRYSDGIPREAMPFSRLVGMANNWRRSHLREEQRLRTAAAAHVKLTDGSMGPMPSRPAGSPQTARRTAVDMLSDLGLPRLGKLYPVAYAAARDADGLTGDEIAAELNIKPSTLRTMIDRSAKKVPSAQTFTPRTHAEALRVDEYREAGTLARALHEYASGADHNAWRGESGTDTPTHPVNTSTTDPTREPWNGTDGAWWTHTLPHTTAARLAYTARLQRTRANGRSADDRAMLRASAGLPA